MRTETDRCTWWVVLICWGSVAESCRPPVLPPQLDGDAGALLLLAAQGRGALLWGRPPRGPSLHIQSLELKQGTLQAEAKHADTLVNQVLRGVCPTRTAVSPVTEMDPDISPLSVPGWLHVEVAGRCAGCFLGYDHVLQTKG